MAVIALLVFGPERLPHMARSFGRALNEFRRQASDIRSEFESTFEDEDDAAEVSSEPKPVVHAPEPKPLPTAEGVEPADAPEDAGHRRSPPADPSE